MMLTVAIIIICIVNVLHLFNTLCVPETVQSPFHALPEYMEVLFDPH